METRAPTKMMTVSGCFFITGTAICPQLSPANKVFKNVKFDCMIVAKDSEHVSHSFQVPCSASSRIIGWINSTEIMDQSVMAIKQKRNDHAKVLMTLANIIINFRSSRKEGALRMKRIKRITRQMRRSFRMRTSSTELPKSRNTSSVIDAEMIPTSNSHSKERKSWVPRTMKSTTDSQI